MNKLHDLIAKLDAVQRTRESLKVDLDFITLHFKDSERKKDLLFDRRQKLENCHNEKVSLLKQIITESEEQLNQLK